MVLRAVAVGLFVLLATIQVARTAAVATLSEARPQAAADVWASHPAVLRSVAMAEVGDSAGRGRLPSQLTLDRLEQLAGAAPLAAEPFLVQAAIAQRAGQYPQAERLLKEARQRAPRSPAARFLLAELYLRAGRTAEALGELSVLGRLVPGGTQQLAPALAQYGASPGAAPELQRIVSRYPELRQPLLNELAEDPDNVEVVLAIAGTTPAGAGASRWQEKLVNGLLKRGEFAEAHALWARLSGLQRNDSRGLFNPTFGKSSAPPPFNWTLASGGGGVAERGGGGLRVLYFGRADVTLASQLLLLPGGRYRLAMTVAGQTGENEIGWTVTCLPGKRQVLKLPLKPQGQARSVSGEFSVPAEGCAAQALELKGVGTEFAQSADFRISGLTLERVGG